MRRLPSGRPRLRHAALPARRLPGAAEDRDGPRPGREHVRSRELPTLDVPHGHVVVAFRKLPFAEEHDRRRGMHPLDVGPVESHDAEEHSVVHLQPREGEGGQLTLAAGPALLDDEVSSARLQRGGEPRGQVTEVQVVEAGDDEGDGVGATCAQAPGVEVDLVAEVGDHAEHPQPGLRPHARSAVDDVRHRHDGDTGGPGDVLHGGHGGLSSPMVGPRSHIEAVRTSAVGHLRGLTPPERDGTVDPHLL